MLEARAVSKVYSGNEVLADIDLAVEPARIVSLIGPSGGGKSTLLRILAGLEEPDRGEVFFEGVALESRRLQRQAIWPSVTLVFQQLFLWPHLTIRENCLLPQRSSTDLGAKLAEFRGLADELGVLQLEARYPDECSIGERQRAAIIRALLLPSRYLLLDEVTSALDIRQVEVLADVLRAVRDRGVGIGVVTHLLGFAERLSDRIYFLDGGHIVEEGAPGILREPRTDTLRRFLAISKTRGL